MSTIIRPAISKKNKYYISKHRYYELKHFCLQYYEWLSEYNSLDGYSKTREDDPTQEIAVKRAELLNRMELVKECAKECDDYLCNYIFEAVTRGRSFTYFSTVLQVPCCKDMYYDRYRKFFYILDSKRI